MVRRTQAKTTTLILIVVVLIISAVQCLGVIEPEQYGICKGCSLSARLSYCLFHANIYHAVVNIWCLLSLAFIYEYSLKQLFTAYLISAFYPVDWFWFTSSMPTVGLSGVCFALMGMVSYKVKRKLYYHSWIAAFIAVGFLLPNANAWLHLYCYVVGLMVGFLNAPIINVKQGS